MSRCLKEKIGHAKEIIEEALTRFTHNDVYISWTGGKDSTTMLWLYRQTCRDFDLQMPRAMSIDEGHVFEEIMERIDRVEKEREIDVAVVKNTDVSDKAKKVGDLISVADLNDRNRQEIKKLNYTASSALSILSQPHTIWLFQISQIPGQSLSGTIF